MTDQPPPWRVHSTPYDPAPIGTTAFIDLYGELRPDETPGSHHPYLCPRCGAVVDTAGESARAVWVRTPGISDYLVVFCSACWLDQGAPTYIEREP